MKKETEEKKRATRREITARWRAKVKVWLAKHGYNSMEAYINAQMETDNLPEIKISGKKAGKHEQSK